MMFLPDIKFFSTLAVTKDFIVCTLANLPRYEFQIGQIPQDAINLHEKLMKFKDKLLEEKGQKKVF